MELKFKHQDFQAAAAKAVVDAFVGLEKRTMNEMQNPLDEAQDALAIVSMCGRNAPIEGRLSTDAILQNIQAVQKSHHLPPSKALEESPSSKLNLTIEMETGVGKTYTYIKTMYELNKHYGWSKFIVVVPSIAIREGVYKTFEMTSAHFGEEYGKKIRFFIYDSKRLEDVKHFAMDDNIQVMIINAQAFNASGKDARRIYMSLDDFNSRQPINVIAATNPIVIIDEPQSVEGEKTKKGLEAFNPLMILRYSATHKADSLYNLIYRLDAMDAYNQQLVKKIAVKGISQSGSGATSGYVYCEGINLSSKAPTASLQFHVKGKNEVRKSSQTVKEGDNLYTLSNGLEEYKNHFVVSRIDGRDNSVEFTNGEKIFAGEVMGDASEEDFRRIQIRETILSHIEREEALFARDIKVLSLFFIDEVAKYKQYDENGNPQNGSYAAMFEEEYQEIINSRKKDNSAYQAYLDAISADKTHAGYFSIDKKGKLINSKAKGKEGAADDVDAYDLIMKNKERLLDLDPKKSPVRFIFSHSALREGWDNPNVFQICTLKQSSSDVRKRQEVGRGLRLCVNQQGVRMDKNELSDEVHEVNRLTVIASESYERFAEGLQKELAQALADRPITVEESLFVGKTVVSTEGKKTDIDAKTARIIVRHLSHNGYIDDDDQLTEKYHQDKSSGKLEIDEKLASIAPAIFDIIDKNVIDRKKLMPDNTRGNNIDKLGHDKKKLDSMTFKELWDKINQKTAYVVSFEDEELRDNAIKALNERLNVPKIYFTVTKGEMEKINSKKELQTASAFTLKETSLSYVHQSAAGSNVKYDLVGKLVSETGLTRHAVVEILKGIKPETFAQFQHNPENFILQAAHLINAEKAAVIINHISYNTLNRCYNINIFSEAADKKIGAKLGKNVMKTEKHLFDHLLYDSQIEKDFAHELEASREVEVYVKLPNSFYIPTPVGNYNPDWAIAFHEGDTKHIYFVAETKGTLDSLELRAVEDAKIKCAKKHFAAISGGEVKYAVATSYHDLLNILHSKPDSQ